MAGYPDQYKVPSRNRQYSNQPGSLSRPEQVMVRDFDPSDPISNHMRMTAEALRSEESIETEMDYTESNQPFGENDEYAPDG